MDRETEKKFAEFLELPEDERFRILTGIDLKWYQKLYFRYLCRWWTRVYDKRFGIPGIIVWYGIRKGRF